MSIFAYVTPGTLEAAKPVFMIVMGAFLMLVAWRLAKASDRWTAWFLLTGAALLGFGYTILLPMYEAGVVPRYTPLHSHGTTPAASAWQGIKIVLMNAGWLIFGLGVTMHAKTRSFPTSLPHPLKSPRSPRESTA